MEMLRHQQSNSGLVRASGGFINTKVLFWASLLSVFAINTALACKPSEGDHFDAFPDKNVLIGIANVKSISITSTGVGETCLSAAYVTRHSLLDKIPENFKVRSCVEDASLFESFEGDFVSVFGFFEGATVMVALVRTEESETGWRYAVLHCWGVYHLSVDSLSDDERLKYLSSVGAQFGYPSSE